MEKKMETTSSLPFTLSQASKQVSNNGERKLANFKILQ
jgi:hypothetical protein